MNIEKILKEFCNADGVSGDEKGIAEKACKALEKYCRNVRYYKGNVIAEFGSEKEKATNILIDAHMDQVGLQVTAITEKGFIKADGVGGIDSRLLPAQRVVIHGKEDIKGVVSTLPPHLISGDKKVAAVNETVIDTGYSYEELKKIVSLGDFISYDMPFRNLKGEYVASPALDDRCGMAAIVYALDLLKKEKLDTKVTVMFSRQEELGEIGAATGCFEINPDIALEVDVSFAVTNDDNPLECGKFEEGAMIGYSPSLSREISDKLKETAEKKNIPYQIEVMTGLTSTNADRFSVCRGGVKACTVSIPLRYMHTPSEVISIKDIEYTGKLLAEFVKGVK
ncbi:MAG: M20/M25/M40 family metallo-hydrolase [Oscillospiraceae bacterium]|nr:M20/M25/M40 family metallo-hydrolase [Oscillospiraceae bacterium]